MLLLTQRLCRSKCSLQNKNVR